MVVKKKDMGPLIVSGVEFYQLHLQLEVTAFQD